MVPLGDILIVFGGKLKLLYRLANCRLFDFLRGIGLLG